MKCAREGCNREATAKGYCPTHYVRERTRLKNTVLQNILKRAEEVRRSRPEYAGLIDELFKEARDLFPERRKSKVKMLEEKIKELEEVVRLKLTGSK